MTLNEEINMQSDAINELAAALAKAQGEMENATINRSNPHFKSRYADLASVIDAMRGPLSKNGLAVSQTVAMRESGLVLTTTLLHSSGQWIASEYPLPQVARMQEMGSALTYARRYSLAALVCNSADEDDDAEASEARQEKAVTRKPPTPGPNVMGEQIDAETGEVQSWGGGGGGGSSAPVTVSGAGSTSPLTIEDMAREAAMRGRDTLRAFYKGRTKAEKELIDAIKPELDALLAGKAVERSAKTPPQE